MLKATDLECVRGNRRIFSGLNFSVAPGGFLQLTGPNGSGKTSLLRIVAGLLAPAGGEITWNGSRINSIGTDEYARVVTYLGHRAAIKDEFTAFENLRISSGLDGIALSKGRVATVLERMGLGGREHLPSRLLSEGQKRRVAVARLIVCNSILWLLDEVLSSLDKNASALLLSIVEEHLAKGGMAIMSTHQELNLSAGSFQRLELAS